MTEIKVLRSVYEDNDRIADGVRKTLKKSGVGCVNVISSPGAGKTTLLEKTLAALKKEIEFGVIEGDISTSIDRDRISPHCKSVFQINTDNFGGDCHLSAFMIRDALKKFDLEKLGLLIIENVGNLICPADFDIGESGKILLFSVTEGEDKPLKYPVSFGVADAIVVTKTDLVPHLDVDMKKIAANLKKINPRAKLFYVSARTGEGLEKWLEYVRKLSGKISYSSKRTVKTTLKTVSGKSEAGAKPSKSLNKNVKKVNSKTRK